MFEKRELFGKTVCVEIPSDVFPSEEYIKKLDDVTGPHCEHGWYESMAKGKPVNLHYRCWLPQNRALKGILIFTMGIMSETSHALNLDGRPLDAALVVDTFVKMDIAVYAMDRYGHGLSEGTRFFIPSWKDLLMDSVGFAKMVSDKYTTDIPLFLGGESFGGCQTAMTAKYFQDHPEEAPKNFDSSILVCPAIEGDIPPFPVYQILRFGLAPLFPEWAPFFMPDTVSPERIWRDSEVQEAYNDPEKLKIGLGAVGEKFRLGTAVNLLLAIEEVRKGVPDFSTPFCIVHGDKDVAVPIGGSKYLLEGSATHASNKELHVIEGSTHGILCDPKAEEAVQHLVNFCQVRMKKFST